MLQAVIYYIVTVILTKELCVCVGRCVCVHVCMCIMQWYNIYYSFTQ